VKEEHGQPKYVLVVDDEPEILSIIGSILTTQGYNVLAAHGGMAALEQIRGREDSVELLITDVVMPDLNGPHLAEELIRRVPGIKVIFTSGWEPQVIAHEGAYRRGYPTLAKPFTAASLLQLVASVLNKSGAAGNVRAESSRTKT